jgi:hypothetical protein
VYGNGLVCLLLFLFSEIDVSFSYLGVQFPFQGKATVALEAHNG